MKKNCKKVIKVDPENLPDYFASSSNTALVVGLTISGILLLAIGGLILFLFLKKKCCFASNFNFKETLLELKPAKFY